MAFAVSAKAESAMDEPIEIIEVKEIGLSDKDETKSVIEVRWQVNSALASNVRSFKILLSVTYADGTKIYITRHTDEESVSLKIEVPSVSFSNRNTPASIKNLKAVVVAKPMKIA
jgi:hypothetical protein